MIAFQDLQTTAEFTDHLEELRAVLLKVKKKSQMLRGCRCVFFSYSISSFLDHILFHKISPVMLLLF